MARAEGGSAQRFSQLPRIVKEQPWLVHTHYQGSSLPFPAFFRLSQELLSSASESPSTTCQAKAGQELLAKSKATGSGGSFPLLYFKLDFFATKDKVGSSTGALRVGLFGYLDNDTIVGEANLPDALKPVKLNASGLSLKFFLSHNSSSFFSISANNSFVLAFI